MGYVKRKLEGPELGLCFGRCLGPRGCVLLLVAFLWLAGCPGPVLLPALVCDGDGCGQEILSEPREAAAERPPQDAPDDAAPEAPKELPLERDGPVADGPTSDEPGADEPASSEPMPEQPKDLTPPCVDKDLDGYCANRASPKGGIDCDDNDNRVFPGNPNYYANPRKGGVWDFNCNKQVEKQPLVVHSCHNPDLPVCTISRQGIERAVGCGKTVNWVIRCYGVPLGGASACRLQYSGTRIQKCR